MVLKFFFVLIFLFSSLKVYGVRVIAISIPKAGTHLLGKLIGKLGLEYQEAASGSALRLTYPILIKLKDRRFCTSHIIASPDNINAVQRCPVKIVYIYRDPRDQIVSNAHYIKKNGANLWVAADLPLQELISKLIIDYSCMYYTKKPSAWNDIVLRGIGSVKNFYDLYQGWHDYPDVYTTTFEKLVGAAGGGSDEVQHQEIYNIARYFGMHMDREAITKIQADLFGDTATFRAGQIGEWKKYFSLEDKKAFKEVAGQLLIDLGYEQDLNW